METNLVAGIDIRKIHDFGIGTYIRHLLNGLSRTSQLSDTVFRLYTESCYVPDMKQFPPHRFPVVPMSSGRKAPLQGMLPGAEDLDLYHAPHYLTPDSGKAPLVLTVHDCIHLIPPAFPDAFDRLGNSSDHMFDAAKRFYHKGQGILRFKKLIRRARHLITVSDATTDTLVAHTGIERARVTRIHNCVANKFFDYGSEEDTGEFCQKYQLDAHDYFLYCGNDLYHKNLAGLLTAWKNLCIEMDPPKLVLAGPPRQVMIREYSRNLGIDDKIVLFDRLPASNLMGLYHGARGLIMPTLAEGFGLPVAEAMAMKTPVICSDISVLREVTGGHAFFFDPYSPPSIASAVKEFLENPETVAANVQAARRFASRYSEDAFISAHIDVYNRVLEGNA